MNTNFGEYFKSLMINHRNYIRTEDWSNSMFALQPEAWILSYSSQKEATEIYEEILKKLREKYETDDYRGEVFYDIEKINGECYKVMWSICETNNIHFSGEKSMCWTCTRHLAGREKI